MTNLPISSGVPGWMSATLRASVAKSMPMTLADTRQCSDNTSATSKMMKSFILTAIKDATKGRSTVNNDSALLSSSMLF